MTLESEFNCEWIDDYLGADLCASDRQRFEQHLAECPKCQDEVSDWNRLATTLRTAVEELEQPDERLLRRSMPVVEATDWEGSRRSAWSRAIAVTGACGLLITGLWLLTGMPQNPPAENRVVERQPLVSDEASAVVELPDDVIGVPLDIGDDSVTVVWLYPAVTRDDIQDQPALRQNGE